MRVAIVTESFLPRVNGVTGSVCRVLEHLAAAGHEAMVLAPAPGPDAYAGARVRLVASLAVPRYRSFPVGLPTAHVEQELRAFRPDVVHVASPVLLGASGLAAARRLGVPSVAVFQTDVAGFLHRHGLPASLQSAVWAWLRHLHAQADLTLAPSSATLAELEARGFPRLARWGRGVDTGLFRPSRRSDELRARLAPGGERLVGYVGRLAAEKRPELLAALSDLPGTRLVLVGDGPAESELRALLPHAAFLGCLRGPELAEAFASLDVFVHPGRDETFCQAAQEALASGVPVVAPGRGGLLDLVTPGHDGFLLDPEPAPGTPDEREQLRTAVARLVGDEDLRARMGLAARVGVAGRSWDAVCGELEGHYGQVVRAARAVRAAA